MFAYGPKALDETKRDADRGPLFMRYILSQKCISSYSADEEYLASDKCYRRINMEGGVSFVAFCIFDKLA